MIQLEDAVEVVSLLDALITTLDKTGRVESGRVESSRVESSRVESSRVESSLYARKWRAPLGTGVKKKWNVNKLQNKYTKFSLHSKPAEVDEVVWI